MSVLDVAPMVVIMLIPAACFALNSTSRGQIAFGVAWMLGILTLQYIAISWRAPGVLRRYVEQRVKEAAESPAAKNGD